MDASSYQAGAARQTTGHRVLAVVFVCAAIVLVVQGARRTSPPSRDDVGRFADRIDGRIDPNVAPWWELTALTGVGEVTARAIVDYRDDAAEHYSDRRPFRVADDLQKVHGIGPKTAAKLAPFWKLD